ncbi:3-hydroxyacyl-CoA dehydrogenase NAD-binding domain-containing protein [Streptomyces sp. NPDC001480]|uniref:3-hydroxyacyl-CoA dehydrogenase family protein n=1 Tax=Streptomyces sp. NPDC001480 TaxID=3364577 RepID=UPI003698AC6A
MTVQTEARPLSEALLARLPKAPDRDGAPVADAARELVGRYLRRAADLHAESYASREDIDTAMRLGCGLPKGPLELLAQGTGVPLAPDATGDSAVDAPVRPVRRVGVVGSGTMARGIAEVVAAAGRTTHLVARSAAKAEAARDAVAGSLERRVRRGRLDAAARDVVLANLRTEDGMSALADCDLVVEAVAEEFPVKRAVFGELDAVCAADTVLATTTSSLSVGQCAQVTGRPGDVIGLHFFNPAPLMALVEVVRTPDTSPTALATGHAFCRDLGKTTVDCSDRTGFIVNYLLFPFLNDAIRMLEEGRAEATDLDVAVEREYGHPMGPFTLLDVVGLDVSLAIQRSLHEAFGQAALAPAEMLEHLVADGHLGRKSGSGFYRY